MISAAVLVGAVGPAPGQGADLGDPDPRAQSLVEDLRRAVRRAERIGSATPGFLRELRGLIARYDAPFGHLVVRDTFQDGAYRTDPRWILVSGNWQAVAGSVVSPPTGPALAPPDRPPEDADRLQEQLGAVTRLVERLSGRKTPPVGDPIPPSIEPQTPPGTEDEAAARLALPVTVPAAFRLRVRVTLEDDPERHKAAVSVRDAEGTAGYRVMIGSFALRSRVKLERLTDQGPRTLGSEVLPQSLAGGPVHTVVLERDASGKLVVRVDGLEAVAVEDRRDAPRLERVMLERMAGRFIVSQVEVWTAAH